MQGMGAELITVCRFCSSRQGARLTPARHAAFPELRTQIYESICYATQQAMEIHVSGPVRTDWLIRQITLGMEADTLPNSWFNHAIGTLLIGHALNCLRLAG